MFSTMKDTKKSYSIVKSNCFVNPPIILAGDTSAATFGVSGRGYEDSASSEI